MAKPPKLNIINPPKKDESVTEILDKHFERKSDKKIKTKKLEKQVIKETKKTELVIENKSIPVRNDKIEFTITETTYFRINWFYIKTVCIHIKHILLSPYDILKNKLKSNKTSVLLITKDENEELYEPYNFVDTKTKEIDDKVKNDMFKIIRSEK